MAVKKIITVGILIVYAVVILHSILYPVSSIRLEGYSWYIKRPLSLCSANNISQSVTQTKMPPIDFHFSTFYRSGVTLIALALIAALWLFPKKELSSYFYLKSLKPFELYHFKSPSQLGMLSVADKKVFLRKYLSITNKMRPRSLFGHISIDLANAVNSLDKLDQSIFDDSYETVYRNICSLQTKIKQKKMAPTLDAVINP